MCIRILVATGYAPIRAGLRDLLQEAREIEVCGEPEGGEDLERMLATLCPDLVLFDDCGGEDEALLERVVRRGVGVVWLGESPQGYQRLWERPLSGWAYLLRDADGQELRGAIHAAAAGLVVLDRRILPLLTAAPPQETFHPGYDALTAREHEVLELMAQGLPNKIIAARLGISLHTVKFHVASILTKLEVESRTEAVTQGAKRGYVTL